MEDFVAEILASMLNIAIEVAFALWIEIVAWVSTSLLAWIQTDLGPLLAESVKAAFVLLGTAAVTSYVAIRKAWSTLRQVLIEALVEFERSSSSTWTRSLTTTLLKVLESGQPTLIRREVGEEIDWDQLPPEVRSAWLNSAQKHHKVDFIEVRDKEIQTLTH